LLQIIYYLVQAVKRKVAIVKAIKVKELQQEKKRSIYYTHRTSNGIKQGGFAKIEKAINERNEEVILKTSVNNELAENELRMLIQLRKIHGVVMLIDTFIEAEKRILVLPHLRQFKYRSQYRLKEIRTILQQLLQVLSAIHAMNIVHLDVNPNNLCELEDSSLVLIDFGNSRFVDGTVYTNWYGTAGYVAPEVEEKYASTTACDIFSAGIIFAHLLEKLNDNNFSTGLHSIITNPRKDNHIDTMISKSTKTGYVDALSLLKELLNPSEKFRITAIEALNYPFFTRKERSTNSQGGVNVTCS